MSDGLLRTIRNALAGIGFFSMLCLILILFGGPGEAYKAGEAKPAHTPASAAKQQKHSVKN